MSTFTVLGIGNRLLCDDGVGIYVVEELMRHNLVSNTNLIIGETDIDYCLDVVSSSDYLVVVDAVITRKEPGTVSIFSINENIITRDWGLSTHNRHLFSEIGCKSNFSKGYIIGIEPFDINFNLGLSPVLTNLLPSIVYMVRDYISLLLDDKMLKLP